MIILIILIIVLLLSFLIIKNLFKSKETILDEIKLNKEENKIKRKQFSMYVENEDGEYEEYNSSNMFPTGYILNTEKSICVDNKGQEVKGVLSGSNNKITVISNKTVYCHIYFDTKKPTVTLTVSTDGTKGTLPTYNHYKQTLTCDTGTTSTFNTKYQRIEISNVGKTNTTCNLNYTNDTSTYTLLRTKVESDNTTNNNGYRYSGKQPNNWVWFNNELWRIIGSIPTKLSDNTTANRVKIIRAESIGGLAYDSSSNTTWESGNTLYTLLNNYYYGKLDATGSSPCLENSTDAYALCNYNDIGISSLATDYYGRMVIDVYMNVGMVSSASTTISAAYTAESGTLTSNTAKVGLMTVSDYGYATSGITYSSVNLSSLNNYEQNNWLYGNGLEWTMTPYSASQVLRVLFHGSVNNYGASGGNAVRPVVYLNPNVYIISGNGTESNPYVLGM